MIILIILRGVVILGCPRHIAPASTRRQRQPLLVREKDAAVRFHPVIQYGVSTITVSTQYALMRGEGRWWRIVVACTTSSKRPSTLIAVEWPGCPARVIGRQTIHRREVGPRTELRRGLSGFTFLEWNCWECAFPNCAIGRKIPPVDLITSQHNHAEPYTTTR
ncbi:uncharacterized protein EI97DRAFT_205543 [Westerdykella ornata]|uniref:Secreted protein n=1 Tax=Westerdykella ornata TaxID=318751 RepID=A0A6A6J7M2_WESOR|nr:uncharacterized protein EI97DRAFT_205543 [Westerdykella ornata]KAF2272570.1 hypothetical protein EI97DRAFT_205543 [Westerdykella ornata]